MNKTLHSEKRVHNDGRTFSLNNTFIIILSPFIERNLKSTWQLDWNNVPHTSKLKLNKASVETWTSSNRQKRTEEVITTRLRIGHTRLSYI